MPAGCQDFDNIVSGEWETDWKVIMAVGRAEVTPHKVPEFY